LGNFVLHQPVESALEDVAQFYEQRTLNQIANMRGALSKPKTGLTPKRALKQEKPMVISH